MKLMKRVAALLLCFLMLSSGPLNAFATDVPGNDVVVETTTTTETTEESELVCDVCGQSGGHLVGCFSTFTEIDKTAYFVSDSVTLYENPAQQPNHTRTFTAEQLPESFVVQYSFPGVGGVIWYMLDTENWNHDGWDTNDSVYGYVNASDVAFEVAPPAEPAPEVTVGEFTICVSGALPNHASLQAGTLTDEMTSYIHSDLLGLEALSGDDMRLAYDISLLVGENKVQPDGTVTVRLEGIDTTKYVDFTIYHLPNTDIEAIQRIMDGEDLTLDNPEEIVPTVGDGYIEFETDGFSIYYIVSGSQSDYGGDDTFYILRGTSVELTNVSEYTIVCPDNASLEECNATVSFEDSTLTFVAADNTDPGTYTINITRDNRWGGSLTGTATIHVLSPHEMFDLDGLVKDTYFSVLEDSTEVPSEPMSGGSYDWYYIHKDGTGYSFVENQWTSAGRYQDSPDGFLNLDVIAASDALEQNLRGQNVIGVIDNGWGEDTRPCVNLTDEEWHNILVQFVSGRTVYISDGAGGTIQLTSEMVNDKLEDGSYRYKMYPYVVKLILNQNNNYGQNGWHVDCAIVDTKTYSVSYEYNLPSTAIIQENNDLLKPETKFYTPGTTGVEVGVMTLGNSEVTGDTSVTIYDTNTLSTSEYKFLYWNTSPDGSGTLYNPDDVLPAINSNVTLYAIWNHTQTSGTVKLQKTEVFEDSNDERKDDGVSYTFTVTIANAEAGKAYPYTIYNADNTIKTQNLEIVSGGTISLLGGQYAIISNVPGGAVTISENASADSEFDVSWNIGSATTEGTAVTATVKAGNQTEIVCTNTYEQSAGTLVIEKTVTLAYENDTLPNDTFTFTVSGDTLVDGTYNVTVDGVSNTVQASNGKLTVSLSGFTAGQKKTITISGIPAGEYTVTESSDEDYLTTAPDGSITVAAGGTGTASFTNEYKRHLVDLTIKKTGWNTTDENQSFIFDVTGPSGFKITVTINGTGEVTIKDLPIGEYTVTERTDWSWRYNMASVTVTTDESPEMVESGIKFDLTAAGETVEFKNNRSWIYWLSGDSYIENQFQVKQKKEDN